MACYGDLVWGAHHLSPMGLAHAPAPLSPGTQCSVWETISVPPAHGVPVPDQEPGWLLSTGGWEWGGGVVSRITDSLVRPGSMGEALPLEAL